MKKEYLVVVASILFIYGCSGGQNGHKSRQYFEGTNYVTPEQFGALGDMTSDDTSAVQRAIDSIGLRGGTVLLSKRYLIDTNNLIVKPGVTLFGREGIIGNPGKDNYTTSEVYMAQNSQIILNPKFKILMQSASAIKGLMINRKGLKIPAPNVSDFAGTCIEIDGEDCYVGYSLIMGFDQAIKSSKHQRLRVEFLQADCTNGIWIDYAYDIVTITNCHFWPFVTTGSPEKAFSRDGIAFKFSGASDMTKVIHCFSYGHKIGFQAEHSAGMVFSFCNADGTPLLDQEPPTTTQPDSIGYDIKGYARGIRLIGCEAWGKGIGFRLEPQNSFNIGIEKLIPITMDACKTELVVDGVRSNCDLLMNGCDIRGIGIKSKNRYGTGLKIAEGSNAQIVGSRFIDWNVAIEKSAQADVMISGTRYIDCNIRESTD